MTIAGITSNPTKAAVTLAGKTVDASGVNLNQTDGVLYLTNLENATSAGFWSGKLVITLT